MELETAVEEAREAVDNYELPVGPGTTELTKMKLKREFYSIALEKA